MRSARACQVELRHGFGSRVVVVAVRRAPDAGHLQRHEPELCTGRLDENADHVAAPSGAGVVRHDSTV